MCLTGLSLAVYKDICARDFSSFSTSASTSASCIFLESCDMSLKNGASGALGISSLTIFEIDRFVGVALIAVLGGDGFTVGPGGVGGFGNLRVESLETSASRAMIRNARYLQLTGKRWALLRDKGSPSKRHQNQNNGHEYVNA